MKYSTTASATIIVDNKLDADKLLSEVSKQENVKLNVDGKEVVLSEENLTKDVKPLSSIFSF